MRFIFTFSFISIYLFVDSFTQKKMPILFKLPSSKNSLPQNSNWNQILDKEVKDIHGVGVKTNLLFKQIGVETVRQLLLHTPSDLLDRRHKSIIEELYVDKAGTFELIFESYSRPHKSSMITLNMHDHNSYLKVNVVYFTFNNKIRENLWNLLEKTLKPGKSYWVRGKLEISSWSYNYEVCLFIFSYIYIYIYILEYILSKSAYYLLFIKL